jgi:hypothetical protein
MIHFVLSCDIVCSPVASSAGPPRRVPRPAEDWASSGGDLQSDESQTSFPADLGKFRQQISSNCYGSMDCLNDIYIYTFIYIYDIRLLYYIYTIYIYGNILTGNHRKPWFLRVNTKISRTCSLKLP